MGAVMSDSSFKSDPEALETLRSYMPGRYISSLHCNDIFHMGYCDLYLEAQDVRFPEEGHLNNLLRENFPYVLEGIDPEFVAKNALISNRMRSVVKDVKISEDGSLTLYFNDCPEMILTTDTEIVDWQWSLSKTGETPFLGYMVACFDRGIVQVSTESEDFEGIESRKPV